MQEKHLFEYAIIRVFPKVEREEFLNVGVLLFCKRKKYLKAKIVFNKEKFSQFSTELDADQLQQNLNAFEVVAQGGKNAGPMGQIDLAERFRWMSAVKSSCIQTSRPHPGFSDDLDQTFEELLVQYVL